MTIKAIHPKTGGAALGAVLGSLIIGVLSQAGVHLSSELSGAIPAFCAALSSWLFPAGDTSGSAPAPASAPVTAPGDPNPVTVDQALADALEQL